MEEMGGRSDWCYYIGRTQRKWSCLCLDFLRNLVFLLVVSYSGVKTCIWFAAQNLSRIKYSLVVTFWAG